MTRPQQFVIRHVDRDDPRSWAVFLKGRINPIMTRLSRQEADAWRDFYRANGYEDDGYA